jgi:hypothetical protein
MADDKIDRHDNAELVPSDSGEFAGGAEESAPALATQALVLLKRHQPLSRMRLARALGLGLQAVTTLMAEMEKTFLVRHTTYPAGLFALTDSGMSMANDIEDEIDLPDDMSIRDFEEGQYWRWRRKKSMERAATTYGTSRLGKIAAPLTREATRHRGFINSRILLEWHKIIPDGMNEMVRPLQIRRDLKNNEAVLVVLVSSATALTIQHYEPQIIERLNSYFGFAAVTKLQLKQGILPLPKRKGAAKIRARPSEAAPDLSPVADDELRAALDRLHAARYTKR